MRTDFLCHFIFKTPFLYEFNYKFTILLYLRMELLSIRPKSSNSSICEKQKSIQRFDLSVVLQNELFYF